MQAPTPTALCSGRVAIFARTRRPGNRAPESFLRRWSACVVIGTGQPDEHQTNLHADVVSHSEADGAACAFWRAKMRGMLYEWLQGTELLLP